MVASSRPRSRLREEILDAAVRILRESGVKMLAQSRVARAAGIPQGHLTYYFPRRADLLVAVARRSVELAVRELDGFWSSEGWRAAGDDVRRRALAIIGFLIKDRERTRMLLGLLVEAEEDPALRAVLIENFGQLRQLLARALERAADDPDVEIAIATLWGLGLQHLMWGDHRPEAATDRLVDRLPAWLARQAAPPPKTPKTPKTRTKPRKKPRRRNP
jgi:DNA-binding transcriptional regulator YbjK